MTQKLRPNLKIHLKNSKAQTFSLKNNIIKFAYFYLMTFGHI